MSALHQQCQEIPDAAQKTLPDSCKSSSSCSLNRLAPMKTMPILLIANEGFGCPKYHVLENGLD